MLKILTSRIECKAEAYLLKEQCGFRKGRGTGNGIAALRLPYCMKSVQIHGIAKSSQTQLNDYNVNN